MDFIFAQSQPVQGSGILSFLPFILIMVILYFFMLRPQAQKQKQKEEMVNNLNKGDKVVTMGGIIGTVTGFKEKGKLITLKSIIIQHLLSISLQLQGYLEKLIRMI